jgi:hypothetical protein
VNNHHGRGVERIGGPLRYGGRVAALG